MRWMVNPTPHWQCEQCSGKHPPSHARLSPCKLLQALGWFILSIHFSLGFKVKTVAIFRSQAKNPRRRRVWSCFGFFNAVVLKLAVVELLNWLRRRGARGENRPREAVCSCVWGEPGGVCGEEDGDCLPPQYCGCN